MVFTKVVGPHRPATVYKGHNKVRSFLRRKAKNLEHGLYVCKRFDFDQIFTVFEEEEIAFRVKGVKVFICYDEDIWS